MCEKYPKYIFDSFKLSDKVAKLEDHHIHLFSVNSRIYDEKKSYSDYFLDDDEQNRAMQFRFRKDHDLFVLGRYITKVILSHYTDGSPEKVKITLGETGKPGSGLNYFFNISHSEDQLLLGFSKSEIGVDIEKTDRKTNIEKIGQSHFSDMEYRYMMKCIDTKRADAFFEIWTKKESLIKGIGKGLHIPLKIFDVTSPNGMVLWKMPTEVNYGTWYVQNLAVKEGFKAAFATPNPECRLSLFMLR